MYIIHFVIGYLIGSIPFGVIISKIWKLDIRRHGSGNIGAANVYRSLGAVAGGVVFLLDYLKGFFAVTIGFWMGGAPLAILVLGASVILGHVFPVFLKFKGGKGVATGFGVLAGIAPDIFLLVLIFVLVMLITTRYVSLTSILSAILASALMFAFNEPLPYSLFSAAIALFITLSHLDNIQRLLQGKEPRLGEKG